MVFSSSLRAPFFRYGKACCLLAACITGIGLAAPASKPVQVIVPFSPGGGSDTLARVLVREINASGLSPSPWVVINIPGAGGTIGSRQAKNALPNGQTLLFLHDGILTAQLSGKAAYGPERFEPVAMTGKVGMVLAVRSDHPTQSLPELLDAAEEAPDSITFAANLGAPSFYLGQLLEKERPEARFRYVQSGGGARRFADVKGGHIQVTVFSVSEFLSFRDGGLRGLAYFGEKRHPALPGIPTALESDVDITYENLQGWWAPKKTPSPLVAQHGETLQRAFESGPVREILEAQSIDSVFLPASAFSDAVAKKGRVLRQVPYSVDVPAPPRIEYALIPLSLLAFGILLVVRERDPKRERNPKGHLILRGVGVAFLIFVYCLSLEVTSGLFPWLSGLLLLALLLRFPISFRQLASLVISSLVFPFLIVMFIEKLLGLPLP